MRKITKFVFVIHSFAGIQFELMLMASLTPEVLKGFT